MRLVLLSLALAAPLALAQPVDLTPVGADLVTDELVQRGRWIWVGDSYSVPRDVSTPFAALSVWPIDRVSALAHGAQKGALRLRPSAPGDEAEASNAFTLFANTQAEEKMGLPVWRAYGWPDAGQGGPEILGAYDVSDPFPERDGPGPLDPSGTLRPVLYVPSEAADVHRSGLRLGAGGTYSPTSPPGAFELGPEAQVAAGDSPELVAEPGGGAVAVAGGVLRSTDPEPGHYAQYLADGSWSFFSYAEEGEPTADVPKRFRTDQLVRYLRATTLDDDQPVVVALYLANEYVADPAEAAPAIRAIRARFAEACREAGLPAPTFLLVHAHDGTEVQDGVEVWGLAMREVALETDDTAFVSLYRATDGNVFGGDAASRAWLADNGYESLSYGRRRVGDLGPRDLSDGELLPDGLHADQDGAAFFAAVLWEELTGERIQVPPVAGEQGPTPAPSRSAYPNPTAPGQAVRGLAPLAVVYDALGRRVAVADARGQLVAPLAPGVYAAGGARFVVRQ